MVGRKFKRRFLNAAKTKFYGHVSRVASKSYQSKSMVRCSDTNLVGTHVRINLDATPKARRINFELDIEWAYALVEENAVQS